MAEKPVEIKMPDNKKLTIKEIAKAILDRDRASKLKAKAFEMMGVDFELHGGEQADRKAEAYAKEITPKTNLRDYLRFCSRKLADSTQGMRAVIRKFWTEKMVDSNTRLEVGPGEQMWKQLACVNVNIKRNPDYYQLVERFEDSGVQEFANIIGLDVKRTLEAIVSEEHAKCLTSVLVNYSK